MIQIHCSVVSHGSASIPRFQAGDVSYGGTLETPTRCTFTLVNKAGTLIGQFVYGATIVPWPVPAVSGDYEGPILVWTPEPIQSYRLIVFPFPLDAHCELTHDDLGGDARLVGVPVVHPSGRRGQAFDLPTTLPLTPPQTVPDPLPNGHGARLVITAPQKVTLDQRGTVYVHDSSPIGNAFPWTPQQEAAFVADDFLLADAMPPRLPRLVVQGQFLAQEMLP